MADNELNILVKLKNLFSKEAANVENDIKDIGKDSEKASKGVGKLDKEATGLGKTLKKFAVGAALLTIAKGLFNIGKSVVATASQFETVAVQFEVLTGSAQDATEILKELSDFSASTPFQFADIARAGKQLIAFGIEVSDVKGRLQEIGDVAAATGADFGEVTTIFGQIQAAGKLTGERLLQLQERAIPIGPALAKSLGVAESAVKGLVSQGAVTTDVFNEAFATLSGPGGVAFGGMSKLSETLAGKISTLKDNISLLANDLGQRLLPALKGATDKMIGFVQSLREAIKEEEKSDLNKKFDETNVILEKRIKIEEQIAKLSKKQAVFGDGRIEKIKELQAQSDELYKQIQAGEAATLAAAQARFENGRRLTDEELAAKLAANAQEVESNAEKNELTLEQEREKQELLQEIKNEYKELELELQAEEDEAKIAKIEGEIELLALSEQQKAAIKQQIRDKETKDLEKKYKKDGKLFEAFLLRKKILTAQSAQDYVKWETFMANAKNSKSKEVAAIGKAIAIKDIAVQTSQAAIAGLKTGLSAGFPVGIVLGPALAAAAIAYGAEQISAVNSAGSFATGGIVGASMGADNTQINAREGEMVLNADQQGELFDVAQGGGAGGDLNLSVNIDGKTIMTSTITNYNEAKKTGILEVDFQ